MGFIYKTIRSYRDWKSVKREKLVIEEINRRIDDYVEHFDTPDVSFFLNYILVVDPFDKMDQDIFRELKYLEGSDQHSKYYSEEPKYHTVSAFNEFIRKTTERLDKRMIILDEAISALSDEDRLKYEVLD